MDSGRRNMDSVGRRTRRSWDEYYKNLSNELKRKDQESGGVIVKRARTEPKLVGRYSDGVCRRGKGAINLSYSEPKVVGGGGAKHDLLSISDENGVQVLFESEGPKACSGSDERGIETLFELKGPKACSGSDENGIEAPYKLKRPNCSLAKGDSGECSKEEPRIESLDYIDSDSSLDSRNSTEDSNGSDESESEPTSEEEDELSSDDDDYVADDYKGGECLSSESSSDDELENSVGENENLMKGAEENSSDIVEDTNKVKNLMEENDNQQEDDSRGGACLSSESSSDDELENSVGENENLMKGAEENSSDIVEDTNKVKNLMEENDNRQEVHDESHEDDQTTGCCNINSNNQEPNDRIIIKEKKKSPGIRRSKRLNPENESGDEIERYYKIDKEKKKKKKDTHNERESMSDSLVVNNKVKSSGMRKSRQIKPENDLERDYKIDKENDESESLSDFTVVKDADKQSSVRKEIFTTRKSNSARDLNSIKILLDSIHAVKQRQYTMDENALPENTENSLPQKFRFEDEVEPPREMSEWEKHIDSLFRDLELGLRESETDDAASSKVENEGVNTSEKVDESPAASCQRGNHETILNEEIGIVCQFCHAVIMDIRDVLPPFRVPSWNRKERMNYYDESPTSFFTEIPLPGSGPSDADSTASTKGTVWDLIPGVRKSMYPHQREGFEFMWKNIAGDILIENLKQTPADDARGCIISHAPGTGKTRLTIMFLQSYMKLYPGCSPMIIAPRCMLRAWEAEFRKWNFNSAFHNLNRQELSGKESDAAMKILGGGDGFGVMSRECLRLLKLYSWATGGSVLGISYRLFEMLAGRNKQQKQQQQLREQIMQILMETPGLLVLDEGHTPRNHKGVVWKALTQVKTQRRIILSGTPFQNSLKELYNTLCVVNPKFANQVDHQSKKRWRNLTSAFGIERGDALKLREILDPFVHVYKGTILEESLPGLRHTLVFLYPTESQTKLLKIAGKEVITFRRDHMVSLVSLHPWVNVVTERYSTVKKPEGAKFNVEDGVKMWFLVKLIDFSDALGERVLVFSQYIDSLLFIKEQLESLFSWNEGRELLYMDGKLDDRKRQDSISSLNDERSEVKVLLASLKACSEGINLVGASRVVLLDTVWNPSVEKQAISRAYRIGQKKVVYVYRLFMAGFDDRQYAHQLYKERISHWIFSLGEGGGQACNNGKSRVVSDDKVLEAMRNLDESNQIFEKVIYQPKQSDLNKTFGLQDQN